ncbi:molybdopterin-dependent aldehyde oxidoreductase [Desulfocicer niacini]
MLKRNLMVNGIEKTVIADPETSLADVLREQLLLTGTKVGCGKGQCGACNVILNGKLVRSCIVKMSKVPDQAVLLTIEGIGSNDDLDPIQLAWMLHGGAQCGFCTPGFIVSTKALLAQNPNPSREDIREWFTIHRNACRCTGYKQLVDAVMDAAKVYRGEIKKEDLLFKMPADGKIWGTNIPRPSAMAKVTGTCDYGADLGIKMPKGTLYLALVQAKVSHAKILGIDAAEAKKMPGVFKILTHKDIKGTNRINGLVLYPQGSLNDGFDRPILADTKVFQYGDAIAIVCADSEHNARAAAEKVIVDLEELPAYMSAPEAMAEDALEIHPGTPNVFFNTKIAKGEETATLFDKAHCVVEDDFYVGRQPHMPIEPDVGLAFTDENGTLTIQSKSIALYLHHFMICDGLGVAPEKLVMVQNPAGGTFGYKLSPTMEALLGVAALATGRPVVLRYNYHQQMTYTGKRSPFFVNLRYAADKDGKLLAMESDWSVDHGAYSELADMLTVMGAHMIGAGYDIPNIRGNGRTVFTNHSWGSAFRAFGAPQSEFASEVLMDILAEKLNIDPLELRYRNALRPGGTMPYGHPPEVYVLPDMIDTLRPKYEAAVKSAKDKNDTQYKYGVGVSIGIYNSGGGGPDPSEAAVELGPEGVFTVYNTWEDHGQGADAGSLGSAHEALRDLNIAPEKIKLVLNDTSKCPNSGPAGASRSQVMTGMAIVKACEALKKAMQKEDGTYRTYEEMVAEGIPLKYNYNYASPSGNCDENNQGNPYHILMFGLFMSEVKVELSTGKTMVEKMTMVADVGSVNNKSVVDGQLYGGLAQGIGLALSENFEDIQKHSTLVGAGFPYAKTVPDHLEIIYQETPRPEGPFGAAGCGELPLTSPHASIINAIYSACGVRITKLPALPEKVLAGLNT